MAIKKVKTSSGQTKWEVYVLTGGRGSRRVRRRFKRKVDAEVFLSNLRQGKFDDELEEDSAGLTFLSLAEKWIEDGKLRFSASHQVRARAILKELGPRIGKTPPHLINAKMLSRVQKELKGTGVSNSTVNRKTEVVTAVLNFGFRQGYLKHNPSLGFRKLPKVKKEMRFWDSAEAMSFLEFADSKYPIGSDDRWVYVAYLIALNTGLRAGEIWGLQVGDIGADKDLISVKRQMNRVTHKLSNPKGKTHRQVPCNEVLYEELMELVSVRKGPKDFIFRNSHGNHINHDTFMDRRFFPDLKKWGGQKVRFHDLRHTAITLMIGAGLDIKTVKEIAGHKDISTTMNYVHLLGENIKKAAKVFTVSPVRSSSRKLVVV